MALVLSVRRQAEAHDPRTVPRDFTGFCPRATRRGAEVAGKRHRPNGTTQSRPDGRTPATENSFAAVATQWLDRWRIGKSPRHADYTYRRLTADVIPVLGDRPITEIQAPELVRMVKAIEARGARDIAERALQTTGQIFRYAIAHGLAQRNPAAEIRPSDILKTTRTVNYARVDEKQLPDLLRKIELYQGTHLTRLAMKLMALTFVRTSELIQAGWSEFDLEAARWDIPAERMKMRTPISFPCLGRP